MVFTVQCTIEIDGLPIKNDDSIAMLIITYLVGGIPSPLKHDGVKVSWDDEIPKIWKNKKNVPNHQPVMVLALIKNAKMAQLWFWDCHSEQ